MVDKNKLARKRHIQRRLARLQYQIDDRRHCLTNPAINTCEQVDTGLESEIAVLNAERIDLNTELDVLIRDIQREQG